MRHFPNARPARLAGLEHCVSHTRAPAREWPRFWRVLAMGVIAIGAGFALFVALWRATP